jgi:hypothetical protein
VARSRRVREPLHLRGTPSRLSGVLALPQLAEVPLSVDAEVAQLAAPDVALQELHEGLARLTLSVSHTTPPGTYEGMVRVGDEEQAVVLEIEPRVQLRLDPRRLFFRAAPGTTVEADLTVTNLGNVPCELRAVDAFGLFDTGGLDRAIGRAFVSDLADGQRRVDVLADAAAEGWGGLVRIRVVSGAGDVEPGETRSIHVEMALSDKLESGRLYWGTWVLYNVNYVVRVEATAGTRKRGETR